MTPFEAIVHSLGDNLAERLKRAETALALGPKGRSRIHLESTAALYRDLLAVVERHRAASSSSQDQKP